MFKIKGISFTSGEAKDFALAIGDEIVFDIKNHSISFLRNDILLAKIEERFDSVLCEASLSLSFCSNFLPDKPDSGISHYTRAHSYQTIRQFINVSPMTTSIIAMLIADINRLSVKKIAINTTTHKYQFIKQLYNSDNYLNIISNFAD